MNPTPDPFANQYPRPHDLWQCTATGDSSCGGCGLHLDPVDPCRVRPSLRLKRGVFVASCTALVAGLLLALLASPLRNDFLAPGPLTRAHARLLLDQGNRRCSACHGSGDKTLGDWMADAVANGRHIPVSQSQLCMDCHDQTLLRTFALLPHNVEPSALAAMTASTIVNNPSLGLAIPTNERGELACAACHREHHGAEFNLTTLSDRQCQTCHASYIHRFESNHPEFGGWPFEEQASRIAFDHSSHLLKHFPEQDAAFDCGSCHIDDQRGNVKLLAPFAQSCATCHSSQIDGPESSEWTVFQLPIMDTAALAAAGHPLGDWPVACDGDFDGQIPPPMKLLLSSDPQIQAIFQKRGATFEFGQLNPDDPGDLADAAKLGWAIKQLINDLADSGHSGIRDRLLTALTGTPGRAGDAVPDELLNALELATGLHPDIFAQARQTWLPDLQQELTGKIPGTASGSLNPESPENRHPVWARANHQQQDDSELLVDNPLANLSIESGAGAPPPVIRTPGTSDQPGGVVANGNADTGLIPTDTLLVENPLAGGGRAGGDSVTSSPDPWDPEIVGQPIPDDPRRPAGPAAASGVADSGRRGWHRNDRAFAITWRSTGHLDPVLKSWTDLAVALSQYPAVQTSDLQRSLTSDLAPGTCMSCHRQTRNKSGMEPLEWSPVYRETSIRGFTRFSHRPHGLLSPLSDCTSCHQLKSPQTVSTRRTPTAIGPENCPGDFAPISKHQCATCHRAGGAPAGCVDCHNYHVGSRVSGD